jgi:hypothetical protein
MMVFRMISRLNSLDRVPLPVMMTLAGLRIWINPEFNL